MTRFPIGLLTSIAIATLAIGAPPVVEGIVPGVGQRGTDFNVTLTGGRLSDPQTLLFYQPGLSIVKLSATSESDVTATLRASADCKRGEHVIRLATKGGASELRSLCIAALPVIVEASTDNNTPKTAQAVPMNSTIAGRIETGDVDCFSVKLTKGQRLSAEIEAVRFGSPLDAVLTIIGPDGKVLVEVDDAPLFRQDPVAAIVAPVDGVYVVAVRDTAFGGSEADRYALHLGSFPRPTAVYPAGGQVGVETMVKLLGEPGGPREQLVKASADFEFYPSDAGGTAPTANPFRVSPFPNVSEAEPNDAPIAKGTAASWPVAFNGIIEKPGDVDHFAFAAKAGEELEISAYAFRVGSPLDTVVAVLDTQGREVAANDDDKTHDSRVRFTAPSDGNYFVRVQDKRKQGGPLFIYRLEVTKPEPGLTLFLATPNRKSQDRGTIVVPRGNRVTAFLAVRRDSVTGPVTIRPGNLPAGVTIAGTPIIAADEYLFPVVFEASSTATLGSKLVDLTGTAGTTTGRFLQSATLVAGPGDLSLHDVEVTELAVTIVDEVPLTVSLSVPRISLATDGSLDVTVKLGRAPDFDEPVEVSFPYLPPGVEAPANVVIPSGKSEASVTLVAQRKADLGNWPIFVEAKPAAVAATRARRDPAAPPLPGGAGGRRSRRSATGMPPVSSEVIALSVTVPPVAGTIAATVGEQEKIVIVKVAFTSGLVPAGFTATLAGLPPRAVAKPVLVAADAKEIAFAVALDPTTPLGDHASLVCELSGTVDGRTVVYRLGRVGLLTVYPPGGVAVDKDGKPLSKLEALRKAQADKKKQ